MKRYSALISIGVSCQCAHQLRRYTGQTWASYFDWLGTPHRGLLHLLRKDFEDCFQLEDLRLTSDGRSVVNAVTGMRHRHLFSKIKETEQIADETIGLEYAAVRSKLERYAVRWLERIRVEPLLFVRHDAATQEQSLEILAELQRQARGNPVDLPIVSPPGWQLVPPHPNIHHIAGVPPSGDPVNWKGDDALWDRVLEKFWQLPEPAVSFSGVAVSQPALTAADLPAPTVLFQVPNQIGLGHMNRMATVAVALREVAPELRTLFAVEGATHGLLEAFRLPYVSLPAAGMMKRSSRGRGALPEPQQAAIRVSIAAAVLRSAAPALIVYDCFPSADMVAAATAFGVPNCLCVRNMKDPEEYAERAPVRKALKTCLSILVPHEQEDAQLPESLRERAEYVGDIVRELPAAPVPVHRRFDLPAGPVVVITAGGGGHESALAFLNASIRACLAVRQRQPDLSIIVVPGPLFTNWPMLQMGEGVRLVPFDPLLMDFCATASLVLCQAGYNSLNEIISLGTPAITVPAFRGFDDQFARAQEMTRRFPQLRLGLPDHFDLFCATIEELLARDAPRERLPTPDGAFRAALHLRSLVESL